MRISDWSSDVCSSDLCRPKHSKTQAYRTCPRIALGSRTGAASAHQISRSTKCSFFDRTSGSLTNPAGHRRSRARRNNGPERWFIRSEEHTSELQSLMRNSYAVFCLKKKKHTLTKAQLNNEQNQLVTDLL